MTHIAGFASAAAPGHGRHRHSHRIDTCCGNTVAIRPMQRLGLGMPQFRVQALLGPPIPSSAWPSTWPVMVAAGGELIPFAQQR
jgi:hypothetical protein